MLKKLLLIVLPILLMSAVGNAQDGFITTWETTTDGDSIIIPTNSVSSYDYTVNWGDGTTTSNHTENAKHIYSSKGIYTVEITGTFQRICFGCESSDNAKKLKTIEQWGNLDWSTMSSAFRNCSEMTYNATDVPRLTGFGIPRFTAMFANAKKFNGDISNWNVGSVIETSAMFEGATSFNQDLGSWNMTRIRFATRMFDDSGMDPANYNATLAGWASQNLREGITLGADRVQYCNTAGRDAITSAPHNWEVRDDFNICKTVEVPYNESFEDGEFGAWSNIYNGNYANWKIQQNYSNDFVPFGDYYLSTYSSSDSGEVAVLRSGLFDLSSLENPHLYFAYRMKGYGISDNAYVVASTDASNWQDTIWRADPDNVELWNMESIDLSAYKNTPVLFRFESQSQANGYSNRVELNVDFIRVQNQNEIEQPFITNIRQENLGEVKLEWFETASVEDGFVVERAEGENSTNFQQIATVPANSESFIDSNIELDKTYSYRLRAFKGSSFSDYSDVFSINTGEVYCYSSPLLKRGAGINNIGFNDRDSYGYDGDCTTYKTNYEGTKLSGIAKGVYQPFQFWVSNCNAENEALVAKIFVDWNGDYDFDDANELVKTYESLDRTGAFLDSLTADESATVGDTILLRMVLVETENLNEVNACGNYRIGGTFDIDLIVTDGLTPASKVAAHVVSPSELLITWNDSSRNEEGFSVERSESPTNGFSEIATYAGKRSQLWQDWELNPYQHRDQNLEAGTTYYYRIRTYRGGEGNYSKTASATPSETIFGKVFGSAFSMNEGAWSFMESEFDFHQNFETWIDYDNDGDLDAFHFLYTPNAFEEDIFTLENVLYENNGSGVFTRKTNQLPFADGELPSSLGWGDYDNDGDNDMFFFTQESPNHFYILENNGSGSFERKQLLRPADAMELWASGCSFIDFDNDGWLDIYMATEGEERVDEELPREFVLINQKDRTFEHLELGFERVRTFNGGDRREGQTWNDIDNDGDLDLLSRVNPNFNQDSTYILVHRNIANTSIRVDTLIASSLQGWSAFSVADYNNDGLADILVFNDDRHSINGGVDTLASNELYRNNGDGDFELMESAGLGSNFLQFTRSASWHDFNNDGYLDVMLSGSEAPSIEEYNEDYLDFRDLYFGNSAGTFTIQQKEVLTSLNRGDDNGSAGQFAWADINKDGFLDVLELRFDENGYFLNNGGSNNYLSINLVGTRSNHSALGAKVKIYNNGKIQRRDQTIVEWLHFGLGSKQGVDSVVVNWPSGFRQVLEDVRANQHLTIVEGESFAVIGVVFHDVNGNKIQDNDEYGVMGQRIMLLPDSCFTLTDEAGKYRFVVPEGNYRAKLEIQGDWDLTTDSTSYALSFPDDEERNRDFGIDSENKEYKLSTSLTSAPTRCGFTVPFWLSYQNNSTFQTDGKVMLIADSEATYKSSSPTVSAVNGDTLVWDFARLLPSQRKQIQVTFEMPGVDNIGDTLTFEHISQAISGGSVLFSKADTMRSEIRCAYDPNDKTPTPFGIQEERFTLKDATLEYRIRFQNTGNDTAFNVVIRDTLQAEFDLNSFEVVASSHEVRTQVEVGKRAIAFHFEDILLVDSVRDEPNSHGFINFRIKPKSGLAENTEVRNKADIYFDFNPAIVTNYTLNTLVTTLPIDKVAGIEVDNLSKLVNIYPNPNNGGRLNIEFADKVSKDVVVSIMDLSGKVVSDKQLFSSQKVELDISNLESGIYFVYIQQGKNYAVKKLIKQ